MSEHIFINIKDPKDALTQTKTRSVRAHITRYQWKAHNQQKKVSKVQSKRNNNKKKLDGNVPISVELDCSTLVSSSLAGSSQTPEVSEVPETTSTALTLARKQQQDQQFVQQSALIIPRLWGGHRVDPFRTYPVSWKPFFPPLMDHYLISMAVDIPELDQPGNRGLLRTRWFPLVITKPCLFLVILLIAASHYAAVHGATNDLKLNLLSLRYEAIQAINEALSSDPEALDDALVGAVAKMASYEAMFGCPENFDIHMRGLLRMINVRGGLSTLGLGGLLRRIVVWIDRNSAFLHGWSLYLPNHTFVADDEVPDPNPSQFLGAS